MESHGIRKWHAEHAVISGDNLLQYSAKLGDLGRVEIRQRSKMPSRAEKDFERPYRPEGDNCNKAIIAANQALALAFLNLDVIA